MTLEKQIEHKSSSSIMFFCQDKLAEWLTRYSSNLGNGLLLNQLELSKRLICLGLDTPRNCCQHREPSVHRRSVKINGFKGAKHYVSMPSLFNGFRQ